MGAPGVLSALLKDTVASVPEESNRFNALIFQEERIVVHDDLVHCAGRGIPTAGFGFLVC